MVTYRVEQPFYNTWFVVRFLDGQRRESSGQFPTAYSAESHCRELTAQLQTS